MFDFIQPPIYSPITFSSEQVNSDTFEFGKLLILKSKENIVLDSFELMGGKIIDRNIVEKFLKENNFVANNLSVVANGLKDSFSDSDLKLEISQINGEKPELFLIAETKKEPDEALKSLMGFDEWFVPNIFKKFTRFNVNINFV